MAQSWWVKLITLSTSLSSMKRIPLHLVVHEKYPQLRAMLHMTLHTGTGQAPGSLYELEGANATYK